MQLFFTKRIAFFILILCISSCAISKKIADPYAHIQDDDVVEILKKSYETLGGLDNWNNIKELHYDKQTTLYLESGAVETSVFQFHDYFYDKNEIKISWKGNDGSEHQIVSLAGNPTKYMDGKIDASANLDNLKTTVTTSLFVIGVPFKMMDQGVTLSYDGADVLEDGQEVQVVKAVYDPTNNAHHTTPDIWWYYFDNQDFRLVGYMVKHADHFSYVRNTSYKEVGKFIFPASRASYRVDPDRNILYTRAEYTYDNWLVKQ